MPSDCLFRLLLFTAISAGEVRRGAGAAAEDDEFIFIELQPNMVQTKSWVVLGRGVERFGPNSIGDTAAALGGDRR